MARWIYEVDLRAVWKQPGWTFEQTRDAVVARIRASRWYANHRDEDVEDVMLELEDAATPGEFDSVWRDAYDLADRDRCWIVTR